MTVSRHVSCVVWIYVLNLQGVSNQNSTTILLVGTSATGDSTAILGLMRFMGLNWYGGHWVVVV